MRRPQRQQLSLTETSLLSASVKSQPWLAFGFSQNCVFTVKHSEKGVYMEKKKKFQDSMVLYSIVERWWTCWGMIDVIRPHCVSGRAFSCHEAPPLIPGADGSLRYCSASPPPPSLCLNPWRRTGLARENKNCFSQIPISNIPLVPTEHRQMKDKT